ncbi:hypothetical protein [Sinorhizobium psoraleae]|uniref:Uncharacterized protein n=1 Tax=Sinorhizobium psoraleae TaxID=520838 RepID=A0ABT4KCY2_9HYPH|nr:hypothetical protein [Sinorhizobium psoraleae]MCZ4088842.1 hypothetical protein [Sinorhizobium psoraleae]
MCEISGGTMILSACGRILPAAHGAAGESQAHVRLPFASGDRENAGTT